MLPDFPELKKKFVELLNKYGEGKLNHFSGFLQQVKKYRHYEGERWIVKQEDSTETESSYKTASSEFVIHNSQIPTMNWRKLQELIDKSMLEMAHQTEEQLFKSLFADLHEQNRIMNHPDSEITIDAILQSLDALLISFDKDGNQVMPTIMVSPEMGEQLKPKLEQWNNDPEINQRFEKLTERKREEWRVRESRRKLVD
jgi:hypothetical protein